MDNTDMTLVSAMSPGGDYGGLHSAIGGRPGTPGRGVLKSPGKSGRGSRGGVVRGSSIVPHPKFISTKSIPFSDEPQTSFFYNFKSRDDDMTVKRSTYGRIGVV